MTYPNLFIVGAMKAGTTTLYAWLQSHPDIYMSPIKEPNFFCSDLWDCSRHIQSGTEQLVEHSFDAPQHNALIRDERLYLRLFERAHGQRYLGESSPSYLRSIAAPQGIRAASAEAKVIMVLRDPVERAWSHFLMEKNEAQVPMHMAEAIDAELRLRDKGVRDQHGILESGLYAQALQRFRRHFDERNILVFDSTDLRDPASVFTRLANFLQVDARGFSPKRDSTNVSLGARYPRINQLLAASGLKAAIRATMPPRALEAFKNVYYTKAQDRSEMPADVVQRLREFYLPDVAQLHDMLRDASPRWVQRYLVEQPLAATA